MAVSESQVIAAYRALLGRDPEDKTVILQKMQNCPDCWELADSIARSPEYRMLSMGRLESLPLPDRLIVVGSHHKTGTQWMGSTFSRVARAIKLNYYNGVQEKLKGDEGIFLQVDSLFRLEELPPYRGVHVVRDPRDVIISGALYHEATEEESWILEPRPDLGGISYQAKLKSLSSIRDKFCFEMDNRGGKTLSQMKSWDYENPCFFEIKYENLIQDHELHIFTELFVFLGFKGLSLPLCLEIAWYSSIFSGKVPKRGKHIRSGAPAQWRSMFTREIAEQFLERFGDILLRLGYERDDSWVESLGA